jgi:hypothetical protein
MHAHVYSVISQPSKNNDEFAEHVFTVLRLIMTHLSLQAKEIHVNEAGRQVTTWASGNPKFILEFGDTIGKKRLNELHYTAELIFILDVNEEGKIVRVFEFNASLATDRFKL